MCFRPTTSSRNRAKYLRLLKQAFKAADAGKIAVLGIQPRWAETGYGYIEFPKGTAAGANAVPVRNFREKPDAATAKRFVRAGNFYWNAGMFFWRTDVLLDALRHHLPKTFTLLAALPAFATPPVSRRVWPRAIRCAKTSASTTRLMEKADNVVGIPADDIGWNDVGSWNAVYELLPRDRDGNAVAADALIDSSTGNYVDANGKLVALLGVKDLVIVDTPDALLIADRHRAQEVGSLVKLLEKRNREDLL